MPFFLQIPVGAMQNFSYLVGEENGEVACIDPGWDAEKIFLLAQKNGVHITKILLTHVHYDHSGAAEALLEMVCSSRDGACTVSTPTPNTSCTISTPVLQCVSTPQIFASANIPKWKRNASPDHGKWVVPQNFTPISGETQDFTSLQFSIGKFPIQVYDAPGHQSDHLLFEIAEYLFTGDTLFIGNIGGTHFEDSNPEEMQKTLKMISTLPDSLIVCPGHDYGAVPMRTLGEEKMLNPYL
ncbi:MAG: MBL fold metallo-hydrolase [Candidatus Peregrinibacteria bacterium]